jgi:hypothetical protein
LDAAFPDVYVHPATPRPHSPNAAPILPIPPRPAKTLITIGPMIIIGEIRSKTRVGASNDDQAPSRPGHATLADKFPDCLATQLPGHAMFTS